MLLPAKHLRLQESILGLGATVLGCLTVPHSFDDLWKRYSAKVANTHIGAASDVALYVLVLDWLYMSECIDIDEEGALRRCVS